METVTPGVVVALCTLAFAVLGQAIWLVIWGASLTQRVKTLEAEVEPLKVLPERFARIEARLDGMFEQLRDLNASVRWMRDPADYGGRPLGGK